MTGAEADWGDKEVADLLAGVDDTISIGVADPQRLRIVTDCTIASDTRFKAAMGGAGNANQISMYGIDQYTFQYDNKIGPRWKNPQGQFHGFRRPSYVRDRYERYLAWYAKYLK